MTSYTVAMHHFIPIHTAVYLLSFNQTLACVGRRLDQLRREVCLSLEGSLGFAQECLLVLATVLWELARYGRYG